MAGDNENMNDNIISDDVSLESILAEYKGTAYINGDKKTPPELLNEQTEQIISEALGDEAAPQNLEFGIQNSELGTQDSELRTQEMEDARAQNSELRIQETGDAGEPWINTSQRFVWGEGRAASQDSEFGIPNSELRSQETRNAGAPWITESQRFVWGDGGAAPQDSEFGIRNSEFRTQNSEHKTQETRDAWKPEITAGHRFVWGDGGAASYNLEFGIRNSEHRTQETGGARTQETGGAAGENRDSIIMYFKNSRSSEPEPGDDIIEDVERAVEREIGYQDESGESIQLNFDYTVPPRSEEVLSYDDSGDEIYEEPELADAMKRFAEKLSSISLRLIPAAVVTLIMIVLTLAAEAGMIIPFGVGRNLIVISGTLVILLLIVMMLCVDLIIRGVGDLARGAPNAETLILFSCAFSLISSAYSMLRGSADMMPYCAVSAVSLTLAAYGEKLNLRAITETLKTAMIASEPYGMQAEYNEEINKSVLKKAYNRTDGFYDNLMHPDIAETAFRYATPILLAIALVLSVISVVVKGRGEYFLHTLSALLAASAPFSALLTFSIPFGIVARSISKSGAAIAGWGGVDDICFTDGASVTDDDLFPPGTLSFNGIKVYEDVSTEKAICYTASLIITSGSGLSRIFSEVLKTQKLNMVRVDNFTCYEGGIGARIYGENVITGSAAFMNLQGIRVPDDVNLKNAVFTAIDNKLIALFAVEYAPINSVQGALISMLKWRIKLFFAMRDFNITPLMLEQKFRVSLEDIEYIQAKDSYSISDSNSGKQGRMAALLTREGLGPFAEAITGGRLLKSATVVATAVSIISAALGLIFVFYMCWNGSFLSAKPGNLLLFMLATLAAVIVVCGYVKCKK